MKRVFKALTGGVSVAAGCYAGYVTTTYLRYGSTPHLQGSATLLDSFLPDYEVRECHQAKVQAPADIVLAAAREISFQDSPIVRLIFALREMPSRLTGAAVAPVQYKSFFEEILALGWQQLGEVPGRQIIMGAVTQPWQQNVVFHGLPPDEFIAFNEPDYAKIAWTLEADPIDSASSVFRTETRVSTTDPISREKFRRYWSCLSPGIIIIRCEMLRLVKRDAERRAAAVSTAA
jgi:hypothetical protein